ncbi:MAG TPA: c-type cytochrome [Dongiaceae bacterium]|nr:c-type cytochrome [Dongiaceae bacterium]
MQSKMMRLAAVALPAFVFCQITAPARAQDAAAGEKLFVKCKSSHHVGEAAKNALGPELNGLFGRKAGSVAGFNYSPAMKAAGFTWDDTGFAAFLQDPKAKVPGTKMMAGQTKDPAQVADLAAYIKSFGPDGKKAQ